MRATVIAMTVFLSACVAATGAAKRDLVIERAAFDLQCDRARLQAVELGNANVYGVTGCGKRATYVVDCSDGYANSCKSILNSPSGSSSVPPAPSSP